MSHLLLPWLTGACDDESRPAVLIPKSEKPHIRRSTQCGRPECDCHQNEAES